MRKWAFLLGAIAVFAALVMACGKVVIADHVMQATATWAGGIFSIPLAAVVRV